MWAALAGAALGAAAGGQKDKKGGYSEGSTTSSINLRDFNDINKGAGGLETSAYGAQNNSFADLIRQVSMGPGDAEIQANTGFQNDFAIQLQGLLTRLGRQDTHSEIAANNQVAKGIFAPQQEQLNQQFQDAETSSNRLSARLGRAGNDPIMRNKLAQEKTRQQSSLNAEIGAYGRQLPSIQADQVAAFGGQLSNLRQGLATSAMNNRAMLLNMGNQLTAAERQYRLNTATRTGNSYNSGEDWSGGGTKGAITGGMAGFGAGAKMMGGMGGGASGGAASGGFSQQASPYFG